jgi:hypothetical protein
MNKPEIKIIALSNVFSRLMHFVKKGDVELGHKHNYDHATLVSTGSVLVEMLDDNGNPEHSKIFTAPNMIFINKDKFHKITALEDNTVCSCIHAIRTVDEDIVSPEFLVEPLVSKNSDPVINAVRDTFGKEMVRFAPVRNPLT